MKKFVFKLILVILVLSCSKDDYNSNQEVAVPNNGLDILQGDISTFPEIGELYKATVIDPIKKRNSQKNDLYDFEIDSSKVTKISFEGDSYYTFKTKQNKSNKKIFKNLVITNKEGSMPEAFVLTYRPDKDYLGRYISDPNTYFSGEKKIQSLDLDKLLSANLICYTVTTTYCSSPYHTGDTDIAGPNCTEPYNVTQTICYGGTFIDAGPSPSGGPSSPSNGGPLGSGGSPDQSSVQDLTSSDLIVQPLPTISNDVIEDYLEEQIDDSKLNPGLKAIKDDLTKLDTDLGEIIRTFAESHSGFGWKMISARLDPNEDGGVPTGETNSKYDTATGTVTTTFDNITFPNATDLSWARTILHELLHAYFVARFAIDKKSFNKDFKTMVDEWNEIKDLGTLQHREIVRNYINSLEASLKEYGLSKGYSAPAGFYRKLAWGGLDGTSFFNETFTTEWERNNVRNVLYIELTGKDKNGNSKPQVGGDCNCK